VEVVGVLGSESYEPERGFLPYPGVRELSKYIRNPFLMEDYAIGRCLVEDDQAYRNLSASIKTKPDIVHVEQPWLFGFAHKYVKANAPSAKIIYGSQNIESELKYQILSSYFDSATAARHASVVKHIELEAIKLADAIVCVSQNDAHWICANTTKSAVLAPNGVKPWHATPAGLEDAQTITHGYRYALYCASAHPPNVTGFFDLFSGGFGSLKPEEKLVIAGGAGPSIAGDLRVHQSAKLAEKIIVAGMVSQPCLEGLLTTAHCMVLPLTQGGGTNLKTAEALWSGKHVVATSIAMRGFEKFMGSSGVQVADCPAAFKRALRLAMNSAPHRLSAEEILARRSVLWENCLSPLNALINDLTPIH